jgi:hypothetical protein
MFRGIFERSLTGVSSLDYVLGRCGGAECDKLVFDNEEAHECPSCEQAIHFWCCTPACPACHGRMWTCWEMGERERDSPGCSEDDELWLCDACANKLEESNKAAFATEDAALEAEFEAEREALGDILDVMPAWQHPPSRDW